MNNIQKAKRKFRSSSKWKDFRTSFKNEVDVITNKKLYKGWNLHHKDLNENHYEDITDRNKFCSLNKSTHEMIHWLYNYYKNDPNILDRIKELLDEMIDYNN